MHKSILATLILALASLSAHAEGLVGGVGLSRISVDDGGYDVTLNGLQGSIGYQFDAGGLTLTPEFRIGTGIKDDTSLGVNVDLKNYYGIDVRAALEGESAYAFVAPSYTNYKIEASVPGIAVSNDSWDFGVGVGVGYKLNDSSAVELSYERVNGAGVVGVGFRMNF